MVSSSRGSTLTPCKSPTPEIPVQPDHFYGTENVQLPPSPDSDGKTWLDPADDPMAHRGIPVFKPTMEEFKDFEGYMNKVECWGSKSGIIKVIPPKEWTASLPAIKPQLAQVKIKSPIEQHMLGNAGLFRQENMEKRKVMSVREWVELCSKDEFRAPGVFDVGLTSRGANVAVRSKTQRKGKQKAVAEPAGPADVIKKEVLDECLGSQSAATPPHSEETPAAAAGSSRRKKAPKVENPKPRARRAGPTREAREASLANRAALDRDFIEDFSPHKEWLPSNTEPTDYTPEFCQKLERQFWRNCGLGKPAWYGADSQGSLFTDATTAWNVAHLPSTLSRLLPSSNQGLPGVNTPYLYFGMWRATFAWHVEDMDLFSINYIHFGAPKFWYAIPQGRSAAMEQTMRGYFPKDTSQCPQFLRHKSFLASPSILANSACRPNFLVQQSGEFVVTFPRGYHAGFNLGLNCAESVNFALDSWLDIGRRAKACECVSDSVRIDVDELLRQREEERNGPVEHVSPELATTAPKKNLIKEEMIDVTIPLSKSRKRKSEAKDGDTMAKKMKVKPSMAIGPPKAPMVKLSVTLKLGPRPAEPEPFPCCLCVSMGKEGLLRVHDPPTNRRDAVDATGNPKSWMAHGQCANIVPETWVDDLDSVDGGKEKVVFGVDGIVKDRWNLKCSACTKPRSKAHGAPVQCTKGKCPKAFHVNCARDGHALGIMFTVMRELEKEVVLMDPSPSSSATDNRSESMNVSSHTTNDLTVTTPIVQPSLSRVLKVIKKLDVQILCTQHNPAVAAQKKASKQDKIRNDLLALPSMARIKIRVSAGVFEVSLIRVIEETSSVEVLWDRGVKREFKWGSVVFGSTDGPVQQKPSEIVVESERPVQCTPVVTFPSVAAATSQQPLQPTGHGNLPAASTGSTAVTTGTIVNQPYSAGTTPYMYSLRTGPFDYWAYASQYNNSQANQTQYPYTYNGYYPTTQTMAGTAQHHNPYAYTQTYLQNQNRSNQLNWQRPYQGSSAQEGVSMAQGTGTIHRFRLGASTQSPSGGQSLAQIPSSTEQCQSSSSNQLPSSSTNSEQPAASALDFPKTSESPEKSSAAASATIAEPSITSNSKAVEGIVEQVSVHKDLSVLSSLQPSQIAEILCNNPEIQGIVWAAVDQAMAKARNEAAS